MDITPRTNPRTVVELPGVRPWNEIAPGFWALAKLRTAEFRGFEPLVRCPQRGRRGIDRPASALLWKKDACQRWEAQDYFGKYGEHDGRP